MKINKHVIVFDAADIEGVTAFWSDLLEVPVSSHNQSTSWRQIDIDDTWAIAVQLDPDHQPPQWPSGNPQQAHLDLYVDDIDAAQRKVLELGGSILHEQADDPNSGFIVYGDPAGHPFCFCW